MNNSWTVFTQEWGTSLIGMFVVFMALIIMIVILELIAKVVAKIESVKMPKKDIKVKEALANEKEESVEIKAENTQDKQRKTEDDLELIAVISAAIAASLGTSSDQLVVRSLRKVERKTR